MTTGGGGKLGFVFDTNLPRLLVYTVPAGRFNHNIGLLYLHRMNNKQLFRIALFFLSLYSAIWIGVQGVCVREFRISKGYNNI